MSLIVVFLFVLITYLQVQYFPRTGTYEDSAQKYQRDLKYRPPLTRRKKVEKS